MHYYLKDQGGSKIVHYKSNFVVLKNCRLCINYSINLLIFESKDIGLKLLGSNCDLLLKTGITLAISKISGKIPL